LLQTKQSKTAQKRTESGITLIETIVALALLAIIAVGILSALATTSKSTVINDEQNTAQSLAQSQLEWVKTAAYAYGASTYTPDTLPSSGEYDDYTVNIAATPLHTPDDGIQKITVTVAHGDKEVARLEGYKVNR
jgi:type II secretory pathway pseudopilin PulG